MATLGDGMTRWYVTMNASNKHRIGKAIEPAAPDGQLSGTGRHRRRRTGGAGPAAPDSQHLVMRETGLSGIAVRIAFWTVLSGTG